MNICDLKHQNKIIQIMDDYFYDLDDVADFNLKNLEEYISSELNINFNFQLVVDNKPIIDKLKEETPGIDLQISRSTPPRSNIIKNISSYTIDDLFHGSPAAKSDFESYINSQVIGHGLLKRGNIAGIRTNEDITQNFMELKNNLFKDLQNFLRDKGVYDNITEDLYKRGVPNYMTYIRVMNNLSDYFFNSGVINTRRSYTGKKILDLPSDINKNRDLFVAYYNAILLSNFDSVLNTKFKSLFDVNINQFNILETNLNLDKYKTSFSTESTLYWKSDDHSSDSAEKGTSNLTKSIISIVPLYTKRNNPTNRFMGPNDLYLIGAKIADFELKYGNKFLNEGVPEGETPFTYFNDNSVDRLKWYIDNIKNENSHFAKELSEFKVIKDKMLSLDHFINDNIYDIDDVTMNSVLTLFTQSINNTYGAQYSTYNTHLGYTLQNIYNQDFNSTRIQNSVFSHLKLNHENNIFEGLNNILNELNENKFKDIYQAIENNDFNYKPLLNILNNILGLKINKQVLLHTIQDISEVNRDGGIISDIELASALKSLTDAVKKDIESDVFKEAVKKATDKLIRMDSSVSNYVSNIISIPLFNAIREAILEEYTFEPVMNAEMMNGNSIPSFKLPNMTYKDTELFELQRKYEFENPNGFKSLLLNSDPVIEGTLVKLEVVNDDASKAYDKLTPLEQFSSDFVYDFLENIKANNKFSVIIGNYSDKSTILAKIINGNTKLPGSNQSIAMESIDKILETIRNQAVLYYKNAINDVFIEYDKLFKQVGITFELSRDFETNVTNINNILSENNLQDLLTAYAATGRNDIKIVEDLHYSFYNDSNKKKIIRLNNYLFNNYRIFDKKSLFEEFINRTEKSLINKLANYYNKDSTISLEDKINSTEILELKNAIGDTTGNLGAFGFTKEMFIKDGKNDYTSLVLDEGKLNPYLKKWLWTNALYRNEYLFISTKGEYMHPHKVRGMQYDEKLDWDNHLIQMAGRLSSMAKRNVSNTSTIETPVRKSKGGIPDRLNLATISDYEADIYLVSNHNKRGQEVHDGSSFIDDTYARMLDASFPGKGYSGTRKQFGTLVLPNSVTIKKDAESVITNDKIRNSLNSPIKFLNKKKQMLNMPIDNITYHKKAYVDFIKIVDGKQRYISEIEINGNTAVVTYNNRSINEDGEYVLHGIGTETHTINNLFDLWNNVLGGIYTIDGKTNDFDERSNEILYDVVIENPELKSKIIHIISNKSAIKAGAVNLNSQNTWFDDSNLLYAEFDSRFMGPQLDASHDADDAEIREVSQVISALSQNGDTLELSQEVYQNIQTVIQTAMRRYLRYLDDNRINDLSELLTDSFIQGIQKSDRDEVTKALLDTLKDQRISIPFSNQNFYNLFIREIITTLNNQFITRHYPGLGAVLIPSHGIIQLYDIPVYNSNNQIVDWRQATQNDILKEALINNQFEGTNEEIFNNYINAKLQDAIIHSSEAELGDNIRVFGVEYILDTPTKYYEFKDRFPDTNVYKVLNKTRDLKPTLHSFEVNGQRRNVFDFKPVRLLYKYLNNELSGDDQIIFNNFVSQYVGNGNVEQYLRAWTQRLLQLLDRNLTMSDVDVNTDFTTYFGDDNIVTDIIKDVVHNYNIPVQNVKFRAAEMVMGDIHRTIFDRDQTGYQIENQGKDYFKNKLTDFFNQTTEGEDFDLKLYHNKGEIYVRFTNNLPAASGFINIKRNPDFENIMSRYSEEGNKIYDVPKNTVVKIEDGKEIIYIKDPKQLQRLIRSFSNLKAIVPKFNTVEASNINQTLADQFQRFYNINYTSDQNYDQEWFNRNKENLIDLISEIRYVSWLKSKDFVASRIPAQSMQSFMPMKNVAYMTGGSNDVYVNISQILLTGGDFKPLSECWSLFNKSR